MPTTDTIGPAAGPVADRDLARRPTDESISSTEARFVSQLMEALAESLQTWVSQPLPWMIDMAHLLDRVQIDDDLQVLRNGELISGKAMWEALLTSDVQQTLMEGVVQVLTWSLKTTTPIISPIETRLLDMLGTNSAAAGIQMPAAPPPTRTPVTPAASEEDARILENLRPFPELQSVYQRTLHLSGEEMVRELSETLTDGLIGYIVSVSDRAVRSWVSGDHKVRRADVTKLKVALTALRILSGAEKPSVILRWFANTNPILDEGAPAEMLRNGERYDWVIRAAASYAQDGE
jgi:hypothetical protein